MSTQPHESEITSSQVFGDIIRYYRERNGLNQQELATRIGEPVGFVKHLERGVPQFYKRIHRKRFELIAHVLQKSPEELTDIFELATIDFGLSDEVEYLDKTGEQIHKIRYLRLQSGMTIEELATACKVSSYMIRKIQLFKTRISLSLWDKIRRAFGIDSNALRQTKFRPVRISLPQKSYEEDWIPENVYGLK